MRVRSFLAVILLVPFLLQADYLEVRRASVIRENPDRSAPPVQRVESGTQLILIEESQTHGYYHVETPETRRPGWVYRTLVRRHRGEIPEADIGPFDPLADPTLLLSVEQRRAAARHLRIGKPQAVHERAREGYVLGHDARLKIPLWVQYELTAEEIDGPADRSNDFRPDTSIPAGARAELSDYRGSGFDRGHMAPAGDMSRSDKVMSESFLLSNMSPQVGEGFNRGTWRELEQATRGWTRQRGQLTVITGPIFQVAENEVRYKTIGEDHVAVPTHFYKIVVDTSNPENVDALAFILPNVKITGQDLNQFLVSIDEIEADTGLDFLSRLPDDQERRLEARKAERLW